MPLRVRIHSSEVSRIRESFSLGTTFEGMPIPDPVMTVRMVWRRLMPACKVRGRLDTHKGRGAFRARERRLIRRLLHRGQTLGRIRVGKWLRRRALDGTPPGVHTIALAWFDRRAELRHDQRYSRRGAASEQRLRGLAPWMKREIERRPVDWEKRTAPKQPVRTQGVKGPHVDVTPRGVIRTDFERDRVEGTETSRDLRILPSESGVGTEEEGVSCSPQMERRPQRRVAILETSAREMLRRRGGDRHALHVGTFPPVELRDAFRREAPSLEPLTDPERGDDGRRRLRLGECEDRGPIEMIVVVVRDDQCVELRERCKRCRRRMKALRTGERQR